VHSAQQLGRQHLDKIRVRVRQNKSDGGWHDAERLRVTRPDAAPKLASLSTINLTGEEFTQDSSINVDYILATTRL
jgi:hypothetical protein